MMMMIMLVMKQEIVLFNDFNDSFVSMMIYYGDKTYELLPGLFILSITS